MKTLLIATDLSENSKKTALYGYNLACQLKADVVLCNAMTLPAELPHAGFVGWSNEEYDLMMQKNTAQLDALRKMLQATESNFKPRIRCVNEAGMVNDVVSHAAEEHQAFFVVVGTHGSNEMAEFVMGDHTNDLVKQAENTLLIVPPEIVFKPIKRIAIAIDLIDPKQDLATSLRVVALAKLLDAEVIITHIDTVRQPGSEIHEYLEETLTGLATKTGYNKIKTLLIEHKNVEAGLNWLCKQGNIDTLAMMHHPRGFFGTIFNGSHTKKMSGKLCLPLLVLPCR